MTDLTTLLQQPHSWLFVPSAILLGALHGLEPGHSKTMMAAFIIAIRGTLAQAVLLGLAATVSHTAVVWAVAMAGLYFGSHWNAAASEPYFQIASAVLIIGVALWMLWRTAQGGRPQAAHRHGHGGHHHDHDHDHDHHGHGHDHDHDDSHPAANATDSHPVAALHADAHARSHADAIERRFADRQASTGQIVAFGLTGGLVPCPAAITVLLLCLQLKRVTLGATLVLSFSVGLALTLVASGALAALGVRHVQRRWSGFRTFARRAPYLSAALIVCVGLVIGLQGLRALGV